MHALVMERRNYMTKIRLRMNTPADVRKTLVRISNMAINGDIDSKTGNTIIAACNAVLNSIRADEYEKKLIELEQLLTKLNSKDDRV